MPHVTLPDGSVRSYDAPITGATVAGDISSGLLRQAIGAKIDGTLCDLNTTIDRDVDLELITAMKGAKDASADALYLIRHSCAHVMAEAIQRVVPGVKLVYGPPLEYGFYYDMYVPDERPISSEDFEAIENEMAAIIKEDRPFTRVDMPIDAGMAKLKSEDSKYKLDNAERAIEAGSDALSWYVTGTPGSDWEDLCRGPHVPSTGKIGAFKVLSLASSYWHGDAKSDSLTRVYGTAFTDKKQLKAYIAQLEEAKKRDHRVVGKQLGLFHIDEAVGQGLVLWKPAGAVIRQELQDFIGAELRKQGYTQVFTPHIGKLDLYRTSGHFPYYQESQFPPLIDGEHLRKLADEGCSCASLANSIEAGDIDGYLLRPMNCPHHIRLFKSDPHSYRDLPVRLCEFGTVYRWEQSGEIGGMTRVRGFTQDDAHIFCTEEQVAAELQGCLSLVNIIFQALDITDYHVRVGLRDPDDAKYVGEAANWDKAEAACRQAAQSLGVDFTEDPGEAAFYGPKIDFVMKDVVGREWQTGTVQVDYNLPERFDLSYIGADNHAHRPVMIHRAPFGSFERFVGVLIEHFGGAFPTWLAPEQVRILPVSEKSAEYAETVRQALAPHGVRFTVDDSNERLNAKIKVAADLRIPYLLVVGERDAAQGTVSVRARGVREDLGALPLDAFTTSLREEIATRGRVTVLESHFAAAAAT